MKEKTICSVVFLQLLQQLNPLPLQLILGQFSLFHRLVRRRATLLLGPRSWRRRRRSSVRRRKRRGGPSSWGRRKAGFLRRRRSPLWFPAPGGIVVLLAGDGGPGGISVPGLLLSLAALLVSPLTVTSSALAP